MVHRPPEPYKNHAVISDYPQFSFTCHPLDLPSLPYTIIMPAPEATAWPLDAHPVLGHVLVTATFVDVIVD
jgi:hypothetical protein